MSHRRGKLKQVTAPDIFNHGATTHTHYLRGAIMISFSRAIKLQTNSNSISLFFFFFSMVIGTGNEPWSLS